MILVIDNYDSFTYNLVQYIGEFRKDIKVIRNDEMNMFEIELLPIRSIIISPGPGRPENAGVSIETMTRVYDHAISTDFMSELTKFDPTGVDH